MNKLTWIKIFIGLAILAICAVALFCKIISDVVFAGILVTITGYVSRLVYVEKKAKK